MPEHKGNPDSDDESIMRKVRKNVILRNNRCSFENSDNELFKGHVIRF
jgi:hypothetical protein